MWRPPSAGIVLQPLQLGPRGDAQLVHFVNQDDDVVADQLGQHFIHHSGVRLAAHAVTEDALHGRKARLGI